MIYEYREYIYFHYTPMEKIWIYSLYADNLPFFRRKMNCHGTADGNICRCGWQTAKLNKIILYTVYACGRKGSRIVNICIKYEYYQYKKSMNNLCYWKCVDYYVCRKWNENKGHANTQICTYVIWMIRNSFSWNSYLKINSSKRIYINKFVIVGNRLFTFYVPLTIEDL